MINIVFEENKVCSNSLVEIAGRAISLLCRELSNYELDGADFILKIKSDNVGLLDMKKIDELYEMGYKQKKTYLKYIDKKIQGIGISLYFCPMYEVFADLT